MRCYIKLIVSNKVTVFQLDQRRHLKLNLLKECKKKLKNNPNGQHSNILTDNNYV